MVIAREFVDRHRRLERSHQAHKGSLCKGRAAQTSGLGYYSDELRNGSEYNGGAKSQLF